MRLPEILSASDVADVLVRAGMPVDRQNVARALRQAPVDGVIAPGRIGQGWRVPRAALLDVLAACLWRRAQRELAPRGLGPGSPASHRLDAAEKLLNDRELARLVPRALQRAVLERWETRRRAEAERRRRIGEFVERRRHAEEEARRRELERERRWHEEVKRREEERRHELALSDCYGICLRLALKDLGLPTGPGWRERPEFAQFDRDWPSMPGRPAWWLPPPGLYEVVRAERDATRPYGYVEPDWRRWVPKYVPGRPWPWRQPDSGGTRG